jgi:aryl-alcohol dehydrogenase-like predicted oxidoreductase
MWGGTDDAQAIPVIKSALDRGITLIDTAPAYGFGHVEDLVGQALDESGARDKVWIATKVGPNWNEGKVFRNAGRARIREEAEDSPRRLRTDVIDIYQVHRPDPKTSIEETTEAMHELYRAGRFVRSA